MPIFRPLYTFLSALVLALLVGCSSDSSTFTPPSSQLKVSVVDGSLDPATAISNASIQIINTDSGNPIGSLSTDTNGEASTTLLTQSVQLKVSAQGYSPSPSEGVPPLPLNLLPGETRSITITLQPIDPTLLIGSISGRVFDPLGNPLIGALVVAEDGSGTTTAGNSDHNGNYQLFNVPAGDITLMAWLGGYNIPPVGPVTLADGDALVGQNLTASGLAVGTVSGHVSFTAIGGDIIDITLLHPGSRQVLPGMRSYTDASASYTMRHIPNGTFEIIASLENDGYVLDPDISVTQGVPQVTINSDAIIKDFKVTGAIELDNPSTPVDYFIPELTATPTFRWHQASSYSNVDFYIVEVVDESGNTVWGGLDPTTMTGPVMIAKQDPIEIVYNEDGTAILPVLEAGHYYQLRIYARKADNSTASGYKLISASETLDGLFRVATP